MVTAVSLWIVLALCLAGVFSRIFDDNTLQRIGLGCVGVGCSPWLFDAPAAFLVALHVGMASYALGTAWKVWKRRPRQDPPNPPRVMRDTWLPRS